MRLRSKLFLWILGCLGVAALLILTLILVIPSFIDSDMVKRRIQTYVVQKTGGTMDFQKAELIPYPLPHIDFQRVSISVPNKATGFVQSLDIYPDVWSLIRGDVKFSKLRVESPRFTVAISEEMEKISLEQIEEKLKSLVQGLTSIAPNLFLIVQGGKLDLTKKDSVAFSFDTIESRLTTSGKSLNISLTCASNLWDNLSFKSLLYAEDLKSDGAVQIKTFRLHDLLTQLFPKIGEHTGDSDTNLSVKFQTLGLRQIKAEVESSAPRLALMRGNDHLEIKDLNLKGDIEIEPKRVSVHLGDFNSTFPDLRMSGEFTLDRSSGIIDLDLEGKSIDVQSTRKSALTLAGDVPVMRDIFDIVRGGRIASLHFSASGKSPDDLGILNNMRISGRILSGDIYIQAKDLSFHDVTGDAVVSKGILEGKNIEASVEGHQGSKGNLKIGLKGKDAPFNLDVWVKADAGQLPSFLRQKQLVKNDAVLKEMDRLSATTGTVQGKLILGDRLDSMHAVIDVSQINLVTSYEPLPFPIMITGGQVFFDEKSIKTTNLSGNLGNSSFTNLTGKISLDDKSDFEINNGQMTISADEIYPWVTSFEKIKPVLKDLPSMKGTIVLSSLNLQGPLYQPKDWKYLANGELHKFTLDSAFFPGKAEETSGMFKITQDELFLKDVRTRMLDSLFTVSGAVREFPASIRKLDLSLQGEAGPKVTAWISTLIQLPADMSVRAPVSVSSSTLAWEKDTKTTFDGRLIFGKETRVSLKLTKTPDELSVHEISIKDRDSDVAAGIMLKKKAIDVAFKGKLSSDTLHTIFTQDKFSSSSLQGDFTINIITKDPMQFTADGIIKGKNIPVPLGYDIPLVVQNISLEARGKSVLVDSAQLLIGEERFSGKGTIDTSQALFSVDMDLFSNGFDWETVEKIVKGTKKTEDITKTGFLENFPLKGVLRIQSGFFKYRQFKWEPFHADVSFDGETIHIRSKKAALCGISTTGDIDITARGAELDIALSAKKLELEPTILCISDKRTDITGTLEMKADLKAKGDIDTIAKSLSGSFNISAKKGIIFKSRSLDKTLNLVNETENFKGKLPDLDKTVVRYRVIDASGTIQGYILEVEKGMLDASTFGILAQGQFDIYNQTVDLNALVAPVSIIQRAVNKIPILGYILGGNLVSIPVKIKGNMYDPQVTFLSPSAVGAAFLGIIERTIKLPVTIIEPILPGKKQD